MFHTFGATTMNPQIARIRIFVCTAGIATALIALTGCASTGGSAPSASSSAATSPSAATTASGVQLNPTTAPSPAPAAVACDAKGLQQLVGQNSTASTVESARVRSGARMARVLRPGQMITKEFDAQRLNLEVDAKDRIVAVRCG